jgi:hypothetical protein
LFTRGFAKLFQKELDVTLPGGGIQTIQTSESDDLAMQEISMDVLLSCSIKDLVHKAKGPRSDKAWTLLADRVSSYSFAQSIITNLFAEHIMYTFFKWQKDESWLDPDMSATPRVILANPARSPVTEAIDNIATLLSTDLPAGGRHAAALKNSHLAVAVGLKHSYRFSLCNSCTTSRTT